MKRTVSWDRGTRFERVGRFELGACAERVFPLLCPVLEYEWLPGWSCTMIYADSGRAERDAVFTTRERMHRRAVWTLITYEAPRLVEYLIVGGKDLVIRLSISLRGSGPERSEVEWRMLFTASPAMATMHLAGSFSEANFAAMMRDRERQLNHYLLEGSMIDG
ncbi:MAG TPA: SRPBCC family protein [Rectinemataceae bacterium]|nr:SRPBCC family protein [Rectinemataceae bacterium]